MIETNPQHGADGPRLVYLGHLDANALERVLLRLQTRLEEESEDNKHLKAEIEHLKRRIDHLEKLIERVKKRSAEQLREAEERIAEKLRQEMWSGYVPRSMFYPTNAVVWTLARAQWADADDRPLEFSDVEGVQVGYEKWGTAYVG